MNTNNIVLPTTLNNRDLNMDALEFGGYVQIKTDTFKRFGIESVDSVQAEAVKFQSPIKEVLETITDEEHKFVGLCMVVGVIADNVGIMAGVNDQIEAIIEGTAFGNAVKLVEEVQSTNPGPIAAFYPLRKDPETAVKIFNLVLEKVRNRS